MVRVIKYCNGCGDQMVEEELEYNTAYCFKCHPDFEGERVCILCDKPLTAEEADKGNGCDECWEDQGEDNGPTEEDRPIDQGVLSDTGVGLLESTIRTLFGNRREDTSREVIGLDN